MHYYSYDYDEAVNLELRKYNYLVELMYVNEARDTLKLLEVAAYPKMKEENRKKVHKRYSKIAHPSSFEVKNVVKLGDLSRVLNG